MFEMKNMIYITHYIMVQYCRAKSPEPYNLHMQFHATINCIKDDNITTIDKKLASVIMV